MRNITNDLLDVAELAQARAASERQVENQHHQRIVAVPKPGTQCTPAGDHARQPVFDDLGGAHPAQQPDTVLRQWAEIPVGLVMPARKPGLFRQVFRLVDEPAPQAAAIDFLETDDIVAADHPPDGIEVAHTLGMRKHVFPAVRHIVAIAGGGDAGLDVVAQQPYSAHAGRVRRFCAVGRRFGRHRTDPCRGGSSPAAARSGCARVRRNPGPRSRGQTAPATGKPEPSGSVQQKLEQTVPPSKNGVL